MNPRRAAYEVLKEVTASGAYANLSLKALPQDMPEKDKKWVTAAVYTALEHLTYIDFLISEFAKGKPNTAVKNVLRLGLCQLLYMDVPASAACDESVKLIKELGKAALAGYVNGVMRSICRKLQELPEPTGGLAEQLAAKHSYPAFLVQEYLNDYGGEFAEKLMQPAPHHMTVRAQSPYTADRLEQELKRRGIEYTRGQLSQNAFKLHKGLHIESELLFTEGSITVQSESAMLICELMDLKSGMRVLDACAAPGGKTAYMAELMQHSGEIVAMDFHSHRKALLDATLRRLKVEIAATRLQDATEYVPDFEASFDAVLIDAPCSGLGVPGKPDARLKRDEGDFTALAGIQSKLLATCSKYVKPGGVLMYSTCTISRRENSDVVSAFLAGNPAFVPDMPEALLSQSLKPRVKNGMLQLFPHMDGTEGFFMARMKKLWN